MRLSEESIRSVRSVIGKVCGSADVWLFGSRVDDQKKGGDIDLYIETDHDIAMMDRLRLLTLLQRATGLRKIDLIIRMPNSADRAIFHTARETGVRL